jgi:hypothetical protein
MLLAVLLIYALVVVLPPLAIWRSFTRRVGGLARWIGILLALFGPLMAGTVILLLAALPGYSGQCGGWLGETYDCAGIGQYVGENLFFAFMTLAMPGLAGLILGLVALLIAWLRSSRLRPPA